MSKRLICLFFLLFLSFITAIAQSVNKHVAFSDYITNNIIKSTGCLRSFDDLLTTFRETNPNVYIDYNKVQCISQPKEYYYTEANATDYINSNYVQDSWKQYNQLYEKNNELIAYLRLEDHKTDKGARGFKVIEEMEGLLEKLIKNRNALKEGVYADRKNAGQGVSGKTYQLLLDLISHEEKMLHHLDANHKKGALGLNESYMNQSFLETTEMLLEIKKAPDNPYPASSYLKSLLSGVENLQNLKKSAVDNNNYTNKSSTIYVNNIYVNYLNYFNNEVVDFLNLFIKNYPGRSKSMYWYPRYTPRYRVKDYKIEIAVKNKNFEDKIVPPLQVINQTGALKNDHFNILNEYVLSLNTRTRSINSIENSLKNYQISLNRLKKRDKVSLSRARLNFNFEYYVVPENDIAVYKKQTAVLLPTYSRSLLKQISTIQELMLEGERLCEELAAYGSNKKFVTGDFSRPEAILKRISVLFDIYETKKERLYKDIRTIYNSYKVDKPSNPWKITSDVMLKAVDTEKNILKDVKQKFFEEKSNEIPSEPLIAVRRDMITNQSKYMAGINRIGPTHGHCPYRPYERMPDELKNMADKLTEINGYIEKGQLDKYQEYVYRYNQLTKDYNKFAELGKGEVESARNDNNRPVYILSQTMALNKFILADQQSIHPKNNIVNDGEISKETSGFNSFKGYPHNNLVFLLDVSGSMKREDKLPLLKKSINYLVSLMRPEDEISIIVYSGKAKLSLSPSSAIETEKIRDIIAALRSQGKTNVNDGIKLAYKTAKDNFKVNGNNRIILATDGELEISNKSRNLIEKQAMKSIQLSVFVFGSKTTSNALKNLSKLGGGNFNHISTENSNKQMIREAKAKKLK